ncbi:TetR/AcrR family transcriptional regulator [Streptomyces sp. NPDC002851]
MTQQGAEALTPGARKILDAAAELFYAQGITAVGVDLIAKRAGVTKKTLYDRFGSKEALVAAYLRERDVRYRAWVEERSAPGSGAERLLAVFDAHRQWLTRPENPRGCAFVNAAAEIPESGHPGRAVIEGQKSWLRGYLRELCAEAGAAEPGRLADELMVLVEGSSVLHGLHVVPDAAGVARGLAEAAVRRAGV